MNDHEFEPDDILGECAYCGLAEVFHGATPNAYSSTDETRDPDKRRYTGHPIDAWEDEGGQ